MYAICDNHRGRETHTCRYAYGMQGWLDNDMEIKWREGHKRENMGLPVLRFSRIHPYTHRHKGCVLESSIHSPAMTSKIHEARFAFNDELEVQWQCHCRTIRSPSSCKHCRWCIYSLLAIIPGAGCHRSQRMSFYLTSHPQFHFNNSWFEKVFQVGGGVLVKSYQMILSNMGINDIKPHLMLSQALTEWSLRGPILNRKDGTTRGVSFVFNLALIIVLGFMKPIHIILHFHYSYTVSGWHTAQYN